MMEKNISVDGEAVSLPNSVMVRLVQFRCFLERNNIF